MAETTLTLHGYDSSVYTRAARLHLAASAMPYDYVRVATFDGSDKLAAYRDLHPFRRVPVLDHAGLRLYETEAILRYLDAISGERVFVPEAPPAAARMQQAMSVYDSYAHRPWVQVIVTERLFPGPGGPDADRIADALEDARRAAKAMSEILSAPERAEEDLATFYLAAPLTYLAATAEGAELLEAFPVLGALAARAGELAGAADILTLPDPAP